MVGYAFITRDEVRSFVLAKNGCTKRLKNAFIVEAESYIEALSWIKENGIIRVILETYCLSLVFSIISSLT